MKSKFLSALLSIAIALGMWLYVITVESPGSTGTIHNIPVVFEGETVLTERGLIIISDINVDVDLTLYGNRSDLRQVDSSNITLKVDLTRVYEPGKHQLEYSIGLPGSVANNAFTVENQSPKYISVTVEKLDKQEIPVVVSYTGSLPESDYFCDKGNVVLSTPTITVSGPQSVVQKIASAQVMVDLTGRTESISEDYRVTLLDADGNPVDAELITVSAEDVHVDLKIERIKFLDLVVNIVSGGGATDKTIEYTITPQKLQVSGSQAALEALGDQLNLGTIHLADYALDAVINLPITLPDTVSNLSNVTEAKVELKFVGLATKEITVGDIELINVPEGMEAELITEVVTVAIRGPLADIAKLTTESVSIRVDMSEAAAGTSTYKATVVIDSKFTTLGAVGVYSVTVAVQQQ